MWMAILGFLGGPVIKGLIDAYNAKLKAGNILTLESLAATPPPGQTLTRRARRYPKA